MCDKSDELIEVKIVEPQIIYEINCQCNLIVSDYILPALSTDCHSNMTLDQTKFTELYATNLPVLRKYFTEMQLIGIQVHTLLQDKLDVSVPDLKIAQDRLNASLSLNLAVQNRAEFSLNKIVNASLQDARSYSNLAQWLLEQSESITDHEQQQEQKEIRFDPTSVWDWVNLITTIAGITGFGLAVWSLLRLRALSILLVMRDTHAYSVTMPSRLIFGTSNKPTETNDRTVDQTAVIIAAIQTYLPLELTVNAVIIMFLATLVVYAVYQYVRKSKQPMMTMTIGNERHRVDFPIMKIRQHVNKDLVIDIVSASSSVTLSRDRSNWLFVKGSMYLDNISLKHDDLNLIYDLPTDFSVNRWTGKRLISILEHDYYMLIRVINGNNTEAFHVVARMLNSNNTELIETQTETTLVVGDRVRKATRVYPDLNAIGENIEMTEMQK